MRPRPMDQLKTAQVSRIRAGHKWQQCDRTAGPVPLPHDAPVTSRLLAIAGNISLTIVMAAGPTSTTKMAGKDEDHQREDQLDRGLGRLFFGQLPAAGAHRIALHAQRLGDARAELVGLNQNRRQAAQIVDAGARCPARATLRCAGGPSAIGNCTARIPRPPCGSSSSSPRSPCASPGRAPTRPRRKRPADRARRASREKCCPCALREKPQHDARAGRTSRRRPPPC